MNKSSKNNNHKHKYKQYFSFSTLFSDTTKAKTNVKGFSPSYKPSNSSQGGKGSGSGSGSGNDSQDQNKPRRQMGTIGTMKKNNNDLSDCVGGGCCNK